MDGREIFSFHLRRVSLVDVPRAIWSRPPAPGLRHVESFLTMQLGAPVLSPRRYALETGTLAWWRDEQALDEHLASPAGRDLADGWHVRLRLYRRWGRIRELDDAVVHEDAATKTRPVVGLTLARLKLSETLRFTRFGKPVERQVRDHPGKRLALAAMRPLTTFCTFSIWDDEAAMLSMVHGREDGASLEEKPALRCVAGPCAASARAKSRGVGGETSPPNQWSHAVAMRERSRRDFHHEFTTMRLVPLGEVGTWQGGSGYTQPPPTTGQLTPRGDDDAPG